MRSVILLSNANNSQDTSVMLRVRISAKESQMLKIAAAVRDESIQEILHRAVVDYIKNTTVSADILAAFEKH